MADHPRFPDIAGLSYPLKEQTFLPKVRTEFESGVVQSRPRFTRPKKRFALKWSRLPYTDRLTLDAFFASVGADVFIWTHPLTGVDYKCIFSDDELGGDWVELDDSDLTVNIEEV